MPVIPHDFTNTDLELAKQLELIATLHASGPFCKIDVTFYRAELDAVISALRARHTEGLAKPEVERAVRETAGDPVDVRKAATSEPREFKG